jgi:hypothetical protein
VSIAGGSPAVVPVLPSFAHRSLDRVGTKLNRFSLHRNPAIASHGVIPRHPPPSGCEFRINSPDDDAFSFFQCAAMKALVSSR